ncbi:hypothetical protein AB0I69_42780 [Streptomyces sp. NPDC050508]|uniref:hypothetical protein n=1 Tax=Streptomyces sp. NPDC050508 TaxID=3155405 RepID=UPI0034317B58
MSNIKERGNFGDKLFREFGEYVNALIEAGEPWKEVWHVKPWPPGSRLWWLHGRFLLAREMAGDGGVRLTDAQVTTEQEVRMAYLEMFPAGMPELSPSDG